jgi:ubiquinone/menaquinone biosynthesis C-methylase UbiE
MKFTGERYIPGAQDVEPTTQRKMYQEHINRYQFAGFFVAGKDVLDLACGVGYGSNYLMTQKPKSLIGTDISKEAIRYAKYHYTNTDLQFLIGNVIHFPFNDKSFDAVIAFEIIEHINNYPNCIGEVKRILRENGFFIISTPRRKDGLRSAFHVHEFDFDEFKILLESQFDVVKFYAQNNFHISMVCDQVELKFAFEDIRTITDIPLRECDTFIAVCGNVKSYPGQMAVFNDDRYILNLEKDVNILQKDVEILRREKDERITNLERELDKLLQLKSIRLHRKIESVLRTMRIKR